MLQRTPLYDLHIRNGATCVDFAGFDMPLHYGSQIEEHNAVRKSVGMFDVSHMGIVDITGSDATIFLRYLLANDVKKLMSGSALYSCMLNENGGVIDDLIVYHLGDNFYRLIINAGCREKDWNWLQQQSLNFNINLELKNDLCILAIQGPQAVAIIQNIFPEIRDFKNLKRFQTFFYQDIQFARTGYTGEDGLEIILTPEKARILWNDCLKNNVRPCGLASRDTLRLEAGFNLYGQDMDENTTPAVSNLAWTVSWTDPERDFIGRKALTAEQQQGVTKHLTGIIMKQPGVLRRGQKISITDNGQGEITSGTFSPTLGYAIALARLPCIITGSLEVERRDQWISVLLNPPPFVKKH